jgi:hypothetical protein
LSSVTVGTWTSSTLINCSSMRSVTTISPLTQTVTSSPKLS